MVKKVDALEIETLRLRLTEAEEALQAISKGMIDAVVVRGPAGPQISTLAGAEEIAAAETFARSILEQATDAVVVCDADGRVSKVSWVAERLLGKSIEGKLLVDALPMEVTPPVQALLSGVRMSSRQVLDLVLPRHSLHGAEAQICLPALFDKYFLLSAGPLSDRLNGCIGAIFTLTEITDRKRTETQQTMLIAELNHRVKNILAIVQSVAWQTLSANQSPSEFKL